MIAESDKIKPDLLKKNSPVIFILDFVNEEANIVEHLKNLSPEEVKKANHFRFKKDRLASIVSRSVLRQLLAIYSDRKPDQLSFSYSEFGKPYLTDNSADIHFNVSHSHQTGLIGFSREIPIGVDVEYVNYSADLDQVAKRFFSAPEVDQYLQLEGDDRLKGFFNCWTRKESFIKAIGHGLSFPLDQFEVSLEPGLPVALKNTFFNPMEKEQWTLQEIELDGKYIGAFSIRKKIEKYHVLPFKDLILPNLKI